MSDYGPPPITACKLWRKTSANGRDYLVGRLGGLRVLVFDNRDRAGDEDATHVLMFSQAAERSSASPAAQPRERAEQSPPPRAVARRRGPLAPAPAPAEGAPPFNDEPLPWG